MYKVSRGYPIIVAQNTAVSDTYQGIGDSIGGIDRKTVGSCLV